MEPFLAPVEKPRGLVMKAVYFFTRRAFGKVPSSISVFSARMPAGFLSFYGKVSRLDKKLSLPSTTAHLVRMRVASENSCLFCMDSQRWYVMKKTPAELERLDALADYRASPLFSDAERAALDFTTELVRDKSVRAETFSRLRRHYEERQVCEIVWLVASEHLYNLTNHGLNIGSDGLCELTVVERAEPRPIGA
jgi:alkylhydroperoxidase family enzyme